MKLGSSSSSTATWKRPVALTAAATLLFAFLSLLQSSSNHTTKAITTNSQRQDALVVETKSAFAERFKVDSTQQQRRQPHGQYQQYQDDENVAPRQLGSKTTTYRDGGVKQPVKRKSAAMMKKKKKKKQTQNMDATIVNTTKNPTPKTKNKKIAKPKKMNKVAAKSSVKGMGIGMGMTKGKGGPVKDIFVGYKPRTIQAAVNVLCLPGDERLRVPILKKKLPNSMKMTTWYTMGNGKGNGNSNKGIRRQLQTTTSTTFVDIACTWDSLATGEFASQFTTFVAACPRVQSLLPKNAATQQLVVAQHACQESSTTTVRQRSLETREERNQARTTPATPAGRTPATTTTGRPEPVVARAPPNVFAAATATTNAPVECAADTPLQHLALESINGGDLTEDGCVTIRFSSTVTFLDLICAGLDPANQATVKVRATITENSNWAS